MGNPIENLGDYNIVREALQAVGGNKEVLYKAIGDTAVAKATPGIMLKGGMFATAVGLLSYGGYKLYCFANERRKKIVNEPALKKEFFEAIDAEAGDEPDIGK